MAYLSIVIPAYNEENRIGATLDRVFAFLKTKGYDFEVIMVDDGSIDKTVDVAETSGLSKENNLIILKNGLNKGKGFSVRRGIVESTGDFVLFTDADLSTPIEEIEKLFAIIGKDCDVVIGSRTVSDSNVKVHQPWYREMMGKIFNLFVKMLLTQKFNDTQCGFKLFRGDVARELARNMKIDGFAFDVELLYLAMKKGCGIKETGVVWNNSSESKVRIIRSSVSMLTDLIKIRAIYRKG